MPDFLSADSLSDLECVLIYRLAILAHDIRLYLGERQPIPEPPTWQVLNEKLFVYLFRGADNKRVAYESMRRVLGPIARRVHQLADHHSVGALTFHRFEDLITISQDRLSGVDWNLEVLEAFHDCRRAVFLLAEKVDLAQAQVQEPAPREPQPVKNPAGSSLPKKPSRLAFQAWKLCHYGGHSQKNVADMLNSEHPTRKLSQGSISRYCREVDDYAAMTGDRESLSLNRETPVDPAEIEKGPRLDGLTKRQRGKREDDDE